MATKTIKHTETVRFYRTHKSQSTKYFIKIYSPTNTDYSIMKVKPEYTFDRNVTFCYNNRKIANKMFMIACLQFG